MEVMSIDEKAMVKVANDAKYDRLRGGSRPGHGRSTRLKTDPTLDTMIPELLEAHPQARAVFDTYGLRGLDSAACRSTASLKTLRPLLASGQSTVAQRHKASGSERIADVSNENGTVIPGVFLIRCDRQFREVTPWQYD